MDKTNLDESFLKLRSGDRLAFADIYTQLKLPVFTVALRIVNSRQVAEDITHDVFIKLFTAPPDASVKNARAYIFQMARNLAIDTLRKKQCDDIDGLEMTAEDKFSSLDSAIDVEKAISLLPCDEREIISLRLNAELSFSEIAKITQLSLPAVYRRYRKAISTLRTLLS